MAVLECTLGSSMLRTLGSLDLLLAGWSSLSLLISRILLELLASSLSSSIARIAA